MNIELISKASNIPLSIIKLVYNECVTFFIIKENSINKGFEIDIDKGVYVLKDGYYQNRKLSIKHLIIRTGIKFYISFNNIINNYIKTGIISISNTYNEIKHSPSLFTLEDPSFKEQKREIIYLKKKFSEKGNYVNVDNLLRDVNIAFSNKPSNTLEETCDSINLIIEQLEIIIDHFFLISISEDYEEEEQSNDFDIDEDLGIEDDLNDFEEEEDEKYDYSDGIYCSSCQMSPCQCSDRERTSSVFDF